MSDYIKKLAEQAGMEWETQSWCWLANPPHLEKFAELVRQNEREACAITAWSIGHDLYLKHHDIREVGSACATAIRARGNHEPT